MRTYKIKDIGRVITGKTPATKIEEFYALNDYQFVKPPDIKKTRYILRTDKYISEYAFNRFKSIRIMPNSILIDCIGDLGDVAISSKACISNQQINSITNIDNSKADPLYMYYYFSTKKDYLQLIGHNGTVMPIINKSIFENIEINIHSINEQQHIVDTIKKFTLPLLLKSF